MKFNKLDLKRGSRWLTRSISIACCYSLLVASAQADQIKVFDNTGQQRSIAEVTPGSTANISITLKSESAALENTAVSLVRKSDSQVVGTATSNAKGAVELPNIAAGDYAVGVDKEDIAVEKVTIQQATPSAKNDQSASLSRGETAALYVGGISAVGGGIAAVASGSSSSSSKDRANLSGEGSLASTEQGSAARAGGQGSSVQTRIDADNDGIEDAPVIDEDDINQAPSGDAITTNDPVTNVSGSAGPGTNENGNQDSTVDLNNAGGNSGAAPVAPTPTPAPPLSGS